MWIETEEAKVSVGRSRGVLERKCKTKVPCNKKSRQLFIPEEIVFHILMWLPANILFNCMRYVCRQWYSIVSSPQFIEQHILHHSTTTTTGFLFELVHEKRGLRLINFGGVTRMDFPHHDMICASCDGLAVVNHPVAGIHVVNPLTRQVIRLPAFREPLLKTCSSFSLVRCASKNSSYKVFVSYTSEFNNLTLKCALVEIGKGFSWKYFNYPDGYGLQHTLCVGSIIYWSLPRSIVGMVDCSFAEASRVSVAFDVESETFFHNPFSAAAAAALEEVYKENKCFIVESGDGKSLSLLVCLERRNVFDVWLMSNACDPKSGFKWKKHCRIDLGFVAVSEKYMHRLWVPEVWVNDGDVVVFRNGSGVFVAYNVKAGRIFRFGREHGYPATSRGFVSGFGFSMVKPSSSC